MKHEKESTCVLDHTKESSGKAPGSVCEDNSSGQKVIGSDDTDASSSCLAADANGVLLSTPPASGLLKGASSVPVTGDADHRLDQPMWLNIDPDGKFWWVQKKDKNQAIIQHFPELFYDEPIIILASDKQHVLEIANFLSELGYSSVYCHEGCTSVQNADAWERYNEVKSSILVASVKSDAFYIHYDAVYQDLLLVDCPPSVQEYDDLFDSLEHRPDVFISEDDEHLLRELVDAITDYQPMSEWLAQKLTELSNKSAISVKSEET